MARILVRAGLDPRKRHPALKTIKKMTGNSGNLLYVNAVARALATPGNEITYAPFGPRSGTDPNDWVAQVNRNFDQVVLPLANAFRASFTEQLETLTGLISALEVPVTLVGIGGQAPADYLVSGSYQMTPTGWMPAYNVERIKRHDRIVLGFCSAILERSAEIGVRGEFTKGYLESIGVEASRIRVIGCPSVYTWGPDHRVRNPQRTLRRTAKLSMNVDFRVPHIERMVTVNAQRYRRLTSPSQDAQSARMILTGKDEYDPSEFPDSVVHSSHPLFAQDRLLFYPNPWGWIDQLAKMDFVFGSRLHGNIAGILGGTPAHLLAHDARTLELASFHGIPHTLYDPAASPLTAEDLYAATDYAEFNDLYPQRFENFLDFLQVNGLTTIYDDGAGKAEEFDRAIEPQKKVGPIFPGDRAAPKGLLPRIRRKARRMLR